MTDDYRPVRNAFTGTIQRVRVDLAPQTPLDAAARQRVTTLTHD